MEVWSFFSGALGLDLGLHEAEFASKIGGIRTTLAVEVDKWCCQTIRHNWPDVDLVEGDVREVTGASLRAHRALKSQARDRALSDSGDVFLMVGGPPCQSFSPGGKRAGLSDPRGNLIYEYLRLIGDGYVPIFEDERNFNQHIRRGRGRSRRGERAIVNLPATRGANIHCVASISPMQLVSFTTHFGSLKADDFEECLGNIAEGLKQSRMLKVSYFV